MRYMQIRGARTHNLKNINIDLPLKQLLCLMGPSGCGKTSLAFHTIFHESKRRYMNSFPASMKLFGEKLQVADVDTISPLLPAFGLAQNNPIMGARTCVLDMLGVEGRINKIFYHLGTRCCPVHQLPLQQENALQMLEQKQVAPESALYCLVKQQDFLRFFSHLPFPTRTCDEKGQMRFFQEQDPYYELLRLRWGQREILPQRLRELGWGHEIKDKFPDKIFFCVDAENLWEVNLSASKNLKCPRSPECKEKFVVRLDERALSAQNSLGACHHCQGHGEVLVYDEQKLVSRPHLSVQEGAITFLQYKRFARSLESLKKDMKKRNWPTDVPFTQLPLEIWTLLYEGGQHFSGFNSFFRYLESKKYKPWVRIFMRGLKKEIPCSYCHGLRLKGEGSALSLLLDPQNPLPLQQVLTSTVEKVKQALQDQAQAHAQALGLPENSNSWGYALLQEAISLLQVASDLGLNHLQLLRKIKTLSASEYQRVLLVKYLSYKGSDALFIFDEPSIGLGEKQLQALLTSLRQLLSQGNSVLVVDHNEFLQQRCDQIIVMGHGPGPLGGEVVFQGSWEEWQKKRDGDHPSVPVIVVDKKTIPRVLPESSSHWITMGQAKIHHLSLPRLLVPQKHLTWVHGENGSGKSSIIKNLLAEELHNKIYGKYYDAKKGMVEKLEWSAPISDVFIIDEQWGHHSHRSTVGTTLGIAASLRQHFAKLPVSVHLGLQDGHFSPNSKLGQCPDCDGRGMTVIDMQFLEDVVMECQGCQGSKLKKIYGDISDGSMTIVEAQQKSMSEVLPQIHLTPKMKRLWRYLDILGIDYLGAGREFATLSGGEKQRVKFISHLHKQLKDAVIFFENISFGLSAQEILRLGEMLGHLVQEGNTVVVTDQNPLFQRWAQHEITFPLN